LLHVLLPRPNLLGFVGQIQPLAPIHQKKASTGEEQRKKVYYMAWTAAGREKVVFQPIFPEQTFALGLNKRENWG
jgi:hypothetical protein